MSLLAAAGPYTLTKTWYVDGTATDVGDVTIGVVDGNGATVVASGTATTNNTDGTYTYSLADQDNPGLLTVTWTRDDTGAELVDRLEVVGARLFTEAQARAFDASALSSTSTFTDADIAAGRDHVTEQLEHWTGRSWVPRWCRVETYGTGGYRLPLHDASPRTSTGVRLHRPGRLTDIATIRSVTVGGTAVPTSNVVVDGATLVRTDGTWTLPTISDPLNVVVEWDYGLAYPADGVDRIALLLLRDRLVANPISDRATSFTDELGTHRFETPGRFGNVSSIPEVNMWVKRHDVRVAIA